MPSPDSLGDRGSGVGGANDESHRRAEALGRERATEVQSRDRGAQPSGKQRRAVFDP